MTANTQVTHSAISQICRKMPDEQSPPIEGGDANETPMLITINLSTAV